MANAKRLPILREMAKESEYPEVVWELAAEIRVGNGDGTGTGDGRSPMRKVLGCAREGSAVLPIKQRHSRAIRPTR